MRETEKTEKGHGWAREWLFTQPMMLENVWLTLKYPVACSGITPKLGNGEVWEAGGFG